jgi:hypothetical protein
MEHCQFPSCGKPLHAVEAIVADYRGTPGPFCDVHCGRSAKFIREQDELSNALELVRIAEQNSRAASAAAAQDARKEAEKWMTAAERLDVAADRIERDPHWLDVTATARKRERDERLAVMWERLAKENNVTRPGASGGDGPLRW